MGKGKPLVTYKIDIIGSNSATRSGCHDPKGEPSLVVIFFSLVEVRILDKPVFQYKSSAVKSGINLLN